MIRRSERVFSFRVYSRQLIFVDKRLTNRGQEKKVKEKLAIINEKKLLEKTYLGQKTTIRF